MVLPGGDPTDHAAAAGGGHHLHNRCARRGVLQGGAPVAQELCSREVPPSAALLKGTAVARHEAASGGIVRVVPGEICTRRGAVSARPAVSPSAPDRNKSQPSEIPAGDSSKTAGAVMRSTRHAEAAGHPCTLVTRVGGGARTDPLGVAKLVAHEVEVALATEGHREHADHLVQRDAALHRLQHAAPDSQHQPCTPSPRLHPPQAEHPQWRGPTHRSSGLPPRTHSYQCRRPRGAVVVLVGSAPWRARGHATESRRCSGPAAEAQPHDPAPTQPMAGPLKPPGRADRAKLHAGEQARGHSQAGAQAQG